MSNGAFINLNEMRDRIVKEFKQTPLPDDNTISYNCLTRDLQLFTGREMIIQIAMWRKLGVIIRKANIQERTLPDGTEGTLFVVQMEPNNHSICPLCCSLQFMVNGVGYFTKDERIAR